MDYSTPGSSFLHYLLEFAQINAQWVSDAIPPSHPSAAPFSAPWGIWKGKNLDRWPKHDFSLVGRDTDTWENKTVKILKKNDSNGKQAWKFTPPPTEKWVRYWQLFAVCEDSQLKH